MRSSATAEDLPNASFAGQLETCLNIRGEEALDAAVRACMASLFTDRAIVYRVHNGFAHRAVALSVGVQRMVRSDLACAGTMFTLDTESGHRGVVVIDGAWGLGETVVQGRVNPDEFWVHKATAKVGGEGKRPVIRKDLGDKAVKLIYAGAGAGRGAERQGDAGARGGSPPLRAERRRGPDAGPLGDDRRGPPHRQTGHRHADGPRVGQGRAHR